MKHFVILVTFINLSILKCNLEFFNLHHHFEVAIDKLAPWCAETERLLNEGEKHTRSSRASEARDVAQASDT